MNVSVGQGVVQAHGGSRRVCGSCLMLLRHPCVWDIKKRHAICGMPLFIVRPARTFSNRCKSVTRPIAGSV